MAAAVVAGCAARNPTFDTDGPAVDARAELPDRDTGADQAHACGTPVVGTGTGVAAEYFDNQDFTGTRVPRIDPTIYFHFPGAPDPLLGADTFSVRWTGKLQPSFSGPHNFYLEYNDGARLFLDGRVVSYRWGPHATTTEMVTVHLDAGRSYDLRLEMFDETGAAVARLSWENACQGRQPIPPTQLTPVPAATATCLTEAPRGTGTGLLGEYFGDTALQARLAWSVDPRVDFDWGSAAPVPQLGRDGFTVRWTGQLQSPISGPLTLYFAANDVGRVWLNGVPLMDSWSDRTGPQEVGATVDAVAGLKYDIRVESLDREGSASARLLWSWPCHDREIIPTGRLYPAAHE